MTPAEIALLVAGGMAVYFLLRPLQRWLEARLVRMLTRRRPRGHRPMIDVTDFTSHLAHNKEDDTHEHRS